MTDPVTSCWNMSHDASGGRCESPGGARPRRAGAARPQATSTAPCRSSTLSKGSELCTYMPSPEPPAEAATSMSDAGCVLSAVSARSSIACHRLEQQGRCSSELPNLYNKNVILWGRV